MPNKKMNISQVAEQVRERGNRLGEQIKPRDYAMPNSNKKMKIVKKPVREGRLGFRLSEETKDLIERAAHLKSRKITDFCVSELTDAARRTIAEHETLVLSEDDRKVFFDTLINPPKINERLTRAFTEHNRRIIS